MKNKIILAVILLILVGGISSYNKGHPKKNLMQVVKDMTTVVDYTKQTQYIISTTTSQTTLNIKSCAEKGGEWYIETKVCEVNKLSETECKTAGGEFNECSSACRNDPKAEVCTMQCVRTCSFK